MRKILLLGTTLLLLNSLNAQFLNLIGATDSLYSEVLSEQRKIYVQLPESYAANPNEKYPVVYVLDGEVFLPTVHDVQKYYSGGFTPEMVIVGIDNSVNRNRDLTPSKVATMYGMPVNEANGEAANFYKFIEEELIPYVEKNYPVTNYRTVIGHSYGGLFTTYALLNNPELFANYLAIDPSIDWDNQYLLKQSNDALRTKTYKGKSLYMSLGGQLHMQDSQMTIDNVMNDDSDFSLFSRSNIAFRNLAQKQEQNGLMMEWEFFPMELHGTIAFPSIKNGLISLFEWFQMEQTDKFNTPDTPTEELRTIIEYRAKKLKDHFSYGVPPYPKDLLNALGYMSMDMEQMEKSKMFFDCLIKYYPTSANAYDSMGDFFERQEDFPKAIEFVSKAFELSGSDYHKARLKELKEQSRKN